MVVYTSENWMDWIDYVVNEVLPEEVRKERLWENMRRYG